jgi:hypothetical protein
MPLLNTPLHNFRLFLHGLRHSIKRELHAILAKQSEKPPETRSTTILILAFNIVVAFVDAWWSAWVLAEVVLGDAIAA